MVPSHVEVGVEQQDGVRHGIDNVWSLAGGGRLFTLAFEHRGWVAVPVPTGKLR